MLSSPHDLEGTHRLDEPVSKTTLKTCGGVPMLTGPSERGIEEKLTGEDFEPIERAGNVRREGSKQFESAQVRGAGLDGKARMAAASKGKRTYGDE
eukprot:4547051-Pleurochrysis_carterae.AAC.1